MFSGKSRCLKKVRVMIVDDSIVVRNILSKLLLDDPEIEVVSSASNPLIAKGFLQEKDIDLVLLDIEMPVMNGIDAIPIFLDINKKLKIIMVSNLTSKNAPVALKALSLGALDYIEKPSAENLGSQSNFKTSLINKIKTICYKSLEVDNNLIQDEIHLRNDRSLNFAPEAIAIASSTGGPKAVMQLIGDLTPEYVSDKSLFLTQHMPPVFTSIFADNLNKVGVIRAYEAKHDMTIEQGCLYVAPGGKHMVIKQVGEKKKITLNTNPQVNFCRPSADPMFDSLAQIYKKKLLGLVLTGMGQDGLNGAKNIINSGGVVLAQNRNSSVVWGMPGSIAKNNICSAVLDIKEMASYIMNKGK